MRKKKKPWWLANRRSKVASPPAAAFPPTSSEASFSHRPFFLLTHLCSFSSSGLIGDMHAKSFPFFHFFEMLSSYLQEPVFFFFRASSFATVSPGGVAPTDGRGCVLVRPPPP